MTQQRKNRKALGPITAWSDAKLAKMSRVSDSTLKDAESLVKGTLLEGLLRARTGETK